jgi:DNA polymerase elongation subunit (family B)
VATGNLNRILNVDLHPDALLEYNGNVYLHDPMEGILVFDVFGTYSKTIPLYSVRDFQLSDAVIQYFSSGKISKYHLRELWTKELKLDETVNNARIENDKLFLAYPDSVSVFQME